MSELAININRYTEIDIAVRRGVLTAVYSVYTNCVKIHSELDTPQVREATARGYLEYDVLFGQYKITQNGKDLLKQYAGRDHFGSAMAYIKRLMNTELDGKFRILLGVSYIVNIPEKWRYCQDLWKAKKLPDEVSHILDLQGIPRTLIQLSRKDINYLRILGFREFENQLWHSYQQNALGRFERNLSSEYIAGCRMENEKGTKL